MTIEQLKYFIDVCETRNMTVSASRFFISPQGFSRSLKALQHELNTELLHFFKGKIEITSEGIVYYTKIKDLVCQLDKINTDLASFKNEKISIALSSYTYRMVSAILAQFQKEHPEYVLLIAEYPDKITEQCLVDQKADLAILTGPIFPRELEATSLATKEAYLCVPCHHPLANKEIVYFSELKDEPFITLNENFKTYDCYVLRMREMGASPKIIFNSSTLEGLKEALVHQSGITIVNPQYNILPNGFKKVKLNGVNPWTLSVAIHKHNKSEATLALYQYILDHRSDLIFE